MATAIKALAAGASKENTMLMIQFGFGLSIKKGHMFGVKESKRKMLTIKLPFVSIIWLNRHAEYYWYECARFAFKDPDWFIENHHAVRQAKRRATLTSMKAWQSAYAEHNKEFRGRIDKLEDENYHLKRKLQDASRDIQAYRRLVSGVADANT